MNRGTSRKRAARRSRLPLAATALAALAAAALAAGAGARSDAETPPASTAPPTISGTPQQGRTLTATSGSWSGSTPITFSYQWRRCDADGGACSDVDGATNQAYTVGSADVGRTLRVRVRAENGAGSASALSDATAKVVAANAPVNTALPAISGTARQGATLTASRGEWTGTATIHYHFRWLRCNSAGAGCGAISGAEGSTYRVSHSDIHHTLRVRVTASNIAGSAQALSNPTAVVATRGEAPANSSLPTLAGSPVLGRDLTADPGRWTGSSPITFAYAWTRCDSHGDHCTTIAGAAKSTYTLTRDDVAGTVRAVVTATNVAGSGKATSKPSGIVQGPPVVVDLPVISGTAAVGSRLTATTGRWKSVTPLTYVFQWTRCDAHGEHCSAIGGASHSTYTPTSADTGHALSVQVRAQNSAGPTWANSKPTAPVGGTGPAAGSVAVSGLALPDRLVVDRVRWSPARIHSRLQPLVARFHVSEVVGKRSVSGALVYAVSVPFGQLSRASEVTSGPDGWATVTFRVGRSVKLRRGTFVVVFVRARKPGEPLLAGVSTRRLVSIRVG